MAAKPRFDGVLKPLRGRVNGRNIAPGMLPTSEQLAALSQLPSGDFSKVSFAVLLHALAAHRRSAVVEMRRGPVEKKIVVEQGLVIDCRSNIATETLGRFLVAQGKLREDEMNAALARSASLGLPLGQILVQQELMTSFELFRMLQQNLARKVLDAFTWRDGSFAISPETSTAESTLKIKPAQLVVTGVMKFARQEEVDGSIVKLIGKRLGLHPGPVFPIDELRLTNDQFRIAERLARRARIDEVAADTSISYEEVSRFLYALAILGIVVPEEEIPKGALVPPLRKDAPAQQIKTAVSLEDETLRNELMQIYLGHRGRDSFDLFALGETATEEEVRRAYLELSRKVSPWRFEAPVLEPLREKAEEVFLAAAKAFAELAHTESRMTLIHRRRTLREEQRRSASASRYVIKTDLLDPEVQYRKGKALLEANRLSEALSFLQFAVDCDAQNSTYGAELAWCQYLMAPNTGSVAAMKALREIIRIDSEAGLAAYYAGEIARRRGDVAEAEPLLRKAAKLLQGDRRPVEALKAMMR